MCPRRGPAPPPPLPPAAAGNVVSAAALRNAARESPREINENTPMVASGLSGNEERSSPCGCNEMKYYTTNEQYSCDMDEGVTRQKTRTCVVLLRSSQRPGGGVATDVLVVNQLPGRSPGWGSSGNRSLACRRQPQETEHNGLLSRDESESHRDL